MMNPFDDDGRELDALYSVEAGADGFDLIVESRGGSDHGPNASRNSDYAAGIRQHLERMKALGMVLSDLQVASRPAAKLPEPDRRIAPAGYDLPLPLKNTDPEELRLAIGRASAAFGRSSASGGNPTKKLRMRMRWPGAGSMSAEALEHLLAHPVTGPSPAEDMDAPVGRSFGMLLAAYYLARCGEQVEEGPDGPPAALGTAGWLQTYDLFFDAMGDGRTPRQFRNSLKNARDTFDTLFDNGRTGWVTELPPGFRRVHEEWNSRTDDELETVVLRLLDGMDTSDLSGAVVRTEGGTKVIISTRRERDPKLRAAAIRLHGLRCKACDFDFAQCYGELGDGFIEVHHVTPLSESGLAETNPATDLTVLCANCHRMVHRRKGVCLSLDELRARLAGKAPGTDQP